MYHLGQHRCEGPDLRARGVWHSGKQGVSGILLTSFGPQIHIWIKVEIPQRKLAEMRSKGQTLSQLCWTGLAPGPSEDRNEHQEPAIRLLRHLGSTMKAAARYLRVTPEGAIHPTQRKGAPEYF